MIGYWSEGVSTISGLEMSNYKAYPADDENDELTITKVTCNGSVSRITLSDSIEMGVRYVLEANGVSDFVGNLSATSGDFGYLADYSMTGLSVEPDHITDGSTPLEVIYTVTNNGNYGVERVSVDFWLRTIGAEGEEEYHLSRAYIDDLPDSSTVTDTLELELPQHVKEENYIVARIDDDLLVNEWDEDNNEHEVYLYSYMPRIISILDVPEDDGGWVDIEFYRSSAEGVGVTDPVAAYQVYRRDLDAGSGPSPVSEAGSGPSPVSEARSGPSPVPGIYTLEDWTLVASVDADGQDEYSVAVETHLDSEEDNIEWNEYFVRAVRPLSGETVLYYSVPHSGYSIDNRVGPADLLDCFHASVTEGNIKIVWQMFEEDAGAEFTVSRSSEGAAYEIVSREIENPKEGFYVFIDDQAAPGTDYLYRVHRKSGNASYLLFETGSMRMPSVRLTLYQNVPNPFNPTTEISYFLPQASQVSLEIFDVAGRRIRSLVDAVRTQGTHEVDWNGRDNNGSRVASGVYFYSLRAGKETLTRKMVLLR